MARSVVLCYAPPSARAQPSSKAQRLAIVHPTLPVSLLTETAGNLHHKAFFAELRRLGYVEGSNLHIVRHSGEGLPAEGLGDLARSVVRQAPDVILTVAHFMAGPLKEATATIPIVAVVNEPVAAGLAARPLAPGGQYNWRCRRCWYGGLGEAFPVIA